MIVYVLVESSTGEVRVVNEVVRVFDSFKKAKDALDESYQLFIDDNKDGLFDIIDSNLEETSYLIEFEDDYNTQFAGEIFEREIE